MSAVLADLIPVFLVIALGAALRRTLLPNANAWEAFERLTYFVLFPALLIVTTATANLRDVPAIDLGAALFLAILIVAALLLLLRVPITRALGLSGAAFTSLFQGAIRWNTYVALAIAGTLFGADGLALASVAIVAMVPLLNFVCVFVLARYAADKPPDVGTVVDQILRNPLIWSVLGGIVLNLAGVPLPPTAIAFAEILGRSSLALGLLVVGAGLELRSLLRPDGAVVLSAILKLALMPAIAIALAYWFGLTGPALIVVAVAASVPSAPGAYVLARHMGGDAPLIARILTVQTIAASATMPIAMFVVQRIAP